MSNLRTPYFFLLLFFSFTGALSAQYCDGRVGTACDISAVKRFTLSNIDNNNDLCDKEFPDSIPDGYSDYTELVVFIKPNTAYQATLEIHNGLVFDVAAFWIDWNQDKTWSEDERIDFIGNEFTAGTYTAVVVAPPGAVTDKVGRIRVISDFTQPPVDPCAETYSGEIEDYGFMVTDSTPASTGGSGPTYCPGLVGNECDINAIKRFTIANIDNNNDLCDKDYPDSIPDGYSDYTELVASLYINTPYTVTLEILNSLVLDQAAFWVDWNADGTWSSSEYYSMAGNGYEVNMFTAVVTPPPTAALNKPARIRVITDFTQPPVDPCAETYSGEVEDYTFIVLNPTDTVPDCVDPSAVTPSDSANSQCTLQTLEWNRPNKAESFLLTLRNTNTGNYIFKDLPVADTSYTIPGELSTSTTYIWLAKSVNSGLAAVNCDSAQFTTSADKDPRANIQGGDTISNCSGTILSLNGGPMFGTLPYTHTWISEPGLLSDSYVETPDFLSDSTGSFVLYYIIADMNNCSGMDSVVVTVMPAAEAGTLNGVNTVFCLGDTAFFEFPGHVGDITWQDSIIGGSWTNVPVSDQSGGIYYLDGLTTNNWIRAVINNGSCSDISDELEIIVNPLPSAPTIVLSGRDSLCPGEQSTLTVIDYTSGLLWNDINATAAPSLVVFRGGTYSVAHTDANTCTSTSSFTLFDRIPAIKPVITVEPPAPYCEGAQINLAATGTGITWNDSLSTTGNSISVTVPGEYMVTSVSADGCVAVSDPVTIVFSPTPATPVITMVDGKLTCNAFGTSYQWLNNSSLMVVTTFVPEYKPALPGNYSVIAVSGEGCTSDTSASFAYDNTGFMVIDGKTVNIYPNPNNGIFNLDLTGFDPPLMVSVSDALNREVYNRVLEPANHTLNLNLVKGVYNLSVKNDGLCHMFRLIVE